MLALPALLAQIQPTAAVGRPAKRPTMKGPLRRSEDNMATVIGRVAPRRWTATRVAHPVRDLNSSAAFYRDVLGLVPQGGFEGHDGYDGRFFALPGGGQLELTTGPTERPTEPHPGTDEDLLVLYVDTPEAAQQAAAELESVGVPTVSPVNPYWDRWGRTFMDPDGYRVVVAAAASDAGTAADVRIERYTGARQELRELFELAEDSQVELDSYLQAGVVLVAMAGAQVIGHLQLVDAGRPGHVEIKNMAVRQDLQGRGIGARLVRAAATLVAAESGTTLVVATASADVGNLRFYQRQGFRMRSVERDAFGPAAGYASEIRIGGIDLRDRVWLDRPLSPATDPGRDTPGAFSR
jgi:ribosomal protein S18 acetylase RimI-like enzyme